MESDQRRDFRGALINDANFSGARLRAPNLENARITDAWLHNTEISGDIEGLVVNGVEVAPLVEAELDRRYPERVKLRATDPAGLAEAWTLVEEVWSTTLTRARSLPEPLLVERVDDEWSFVETLRHLVFATDCWLLRMIRHEAHPYHAWGLAGPWLTNPASLGLDYAARPSFGEVLDVWRGRTNLANETITMVTPAELERICIPPDSPGHPMAPETVLHCLRVLLDEMWQHSRYANRDLDTLSERPSPSPL